MGTQTAEALIQSLRFVLDTFLDAGERLKLSKCTFRTREVEVHGHCIDKQGVKHCELHLRGISDLWQPENGEDLMRFLRLAQYFAEFLNNFADIARLLNAVLRATGFNKRTRPGKSSYRIRGRGGAMQAKAWRHPKDALSHPQSLVSPRRGALKRLLTDASGYSIGGAPLEGRPWNLATGGFCKLQDDKCRV